MTQAYAGRYRKKDGIALDKQGRRMKIAPFELAENVADVLKCSPSEAWMTIDIVFQAMYSLLARAAEVDNADITECTIPRFGKFTIEVKPGYTQYMAFLGREVKVKPKRVMNFYPDQQIAKQLKISYDESDETYQGES